ncbi:hypothetical protein ACLBV5_13220 [Brevundimonas sp. M1A4_2e]
MAEVKHTPGPEVDFEAVSAGVLHAIRPVVEREMREAANQLYGATMEAVQDYLSDNVNFNIRSRLNASEAGRRAEWERAEALTQQRDDLFWALKGLVQMARTSGGVAGADSALIAACEKGERAIEATFEAALSKATAQQEGR